MEDAQTRFAAMKHTFRVAAMAAATLLLAALAVASAGSYTVHLPVLVRNANPTLSPTGNPATRTPTPTATQTSTLTPTPTATPHDVPPIIEPPVLPAELHVGQPITINLKVFDYDGDPITLSVTQQLGMGDRYAGSEYVTAQPLQELFLSGSTLRVEAQYPGSYRLLAAASDDDGTTHRRIDVPVRLSRPPNYQVRGMTLGATQWPVTALARVDDTLDRMISAGVNCITLITDWYVDDYTDYTIEPWYRDRPGFPGNQDWFYPTLYDYEVRDIIKLAHARNLWVILKPHADVLQQPFGGRGRWGLEPAGGHWDALFRSYADFILHYARIAEDEEVEVFVIGCEMNSMTDPNFLGVPDPDRRWRVLIRSVRQVYHGDVTYSTSFHGDYGDTWCAPLSVSFWDALDLIGFEIYKGLSRDSIDPPVELLQQSFESILRGYVVPLSQSYGKQVLIPEMDFHSFDGVNSDPIGSGPHSTVADWDEQARLYTAVLQALSDEGDWLRGIVWWAGYTIGAGDSLDWLAGDTSDWIWSKPAEKAIRYNWTAHGESLRPGSAAP
jgi:hypothetical protein